MAVNWKFYPPHVELYTATLTATTGTSSTLANIIEPHRGYKMDVDTVGTYVSGADEFMFRVDFGASVTKTCDFIALIDHNLYSETAALAVYVDNADNAALTDPAFMLNSENAVAANSPIWLEEADNERTKRYFWVLFDSISTAAYCGALLLGDKVEPTVDPNWDSPCEVDIESGRIVNKTPDGWNWKTRTHGLKNAWVVKYQFLSDANLAILTGWLRNDDYIDQPFVFTPDGGTTFYYAELMGNPIIKTVQAGLTDVEFTMVEIIA